MSQDVCEWVIGMVGQCVCVCVCGIDRTAGKMPWSIVDLQHDLSVCVYVCV